MLNLIHDPWLRLIRLDLSTGTRFTELGRWSEITRDFDSRPVVEIQSSRPDLRGALYTLGIGLLQTACAPENDVRWRAWLNQPPSPEQLQERLEPLAPYFELCAQGPAFAQALELQEDREEPIPISQLLIEQPASDTIKKNRDFLVKRGNAELMCPACAAAALYAMQAFAPSGGRGHMTSLRGGGPLTTLPIATRLWHTLWFSVLTKGGFAALNSECEEDDPALRFPWLATSRPKPESGDRWLPGMLDPLQCYWAMPRRLRLHPAVEANAPCDLCQQPCERGFRHFTSRPFGYAFAEGWKHPLTPYYHLKPGQLLPVKGSENGVNFSNWYGYVAAPYEQAKDVKQGDRQPAAVVAGYRSRGRLLDSRFSAVSSVPRLWAFGYAMDNKKAVYWVDQQMPALIAPDPEQARAWLERIIPRIRGLVESADQVRRTLAQQFKIGYFRSPKSAKGDFARLDNAFWDQSEADFFAAVDQLSQDPLEDLVRIQICEDWLKGLQRRALALYDLELDARILGVADPERIIQARNALWRFTSHKGKKLREQLDLPVIEEEDKSVIKPGTKTTRTKKKGSP